MRSLVQRPRRLRGNIAIRDFMAETVLLKTDLVYPLFVREGGSEPEHIDAMPGQYRWPLARVDEPVAKALEAGVRAFLIFGLPSSKDSSGSGSFRVDGVVPQAVRSIRQRFPEAYLISDLCLCAYTSHGHCGIPDEKGKIQNDVTLPILVKMAEAHADAGVDMIAPSDMMDGRIGAIRSGLDAKGFCDLPIMSYSAKYASSFYGPFREAADSAPASGDRRSYQMNPANSREAVREMALDVDEGADIIMIKPAIAYLDIIKMARELFSCPVAAYQVSGEYSMIKAAADRGMVDEKAVAMESLTSIKRAGADWIMTYFAPQAAVWLAER